MPRQLKWFRKAADQGEDVAQYNLGLMYARGQGVQQNHAEAVTWFRKAADQENTEAKKMLARINCERLPGSITYYVAACVARGMELSHQLEGLSDLKAKLARERPPQESVPRKLSRYSSKRLMYPPSY
jgi:TPR repeat protein